MKTHPNAIVATGTGSAGIVVVWLLGRFGVDVPAEVGALIAVGAASAALFVGRNGIRGIARIIWRGTS